jgi:hypothetical protein
MKKPLGTYLVSGAIAAALVLICRPAAAVPGQQIKIEVTLLEGSPAPSDTGVQFLAGCGKTNDERRSMFS